MLDQRIPYIGISPYMKASQNQRSAMAGSLLHADHGQRRHSALQDSWFRVTGHRIVRRYPWFSVDSTTWALSAAYGNILLPALRKQFQI